MNATIIIRFGVASVTGQAPHVEQAAPQGYQHLLLGQSQLFWIFSEGRNF